MCGETEDTQYVLVLNSDEDVEVLTEDNIVDVGHLCEECRDHFAKLPHYVVIPAIEMD